METIKLYLGRYLQTWRNGVIIPTYNMYIVYEFSIVHNFFLFTIINVFLSRSKLSESAQPQRI